MDIQVIQKLEVELSQMALDEILEKYGIDPASGVLDELDAQVAKAKLFAPDSGVVISAVSVGRSVSTTTIAFVIGDGSQLEVVADADPGTANELFKNMFEGMPVKVSPNNNPAITWAAKIRQLPSPYGTGSSDSQTVRILIDDTLAPDALIAGDTVNITVELANKAGILWLPPEAIRQVGGRTFVIVNGDNGPQRIDIEVGLKTRDMVEIISGLTEGQVVIGQ
jgi:hypothetical protein